MSLDWSVRDVQDFESLDPGLTECMVWMTLILGIPRITAQNAHTFSRRMRIWEHVAGPIRANGEALPADLPQRYIGLHTNASSMRDTEFKTKVWNYLNRLP